MKPEAGPAPSGRRAAGRTLGSSRRRASEPAGRPDPGRPMRGRARAAPGPADRPAGTPATLREPRVAGPRLLEGGGRPPARPWALPHPRTAAAGSAMRRDAPSGGPGALARPSPRACREPRRREAGARLLTQPPCYTGAAGAAHGSFPSRAARTSAARPPPGPGPRTTRQQRCAARGRSSLQVRYREKWSSHEAPTGAGALQLPPRRPGGYCPGRRGGASGTKLARFGRVAAASSCERPEVGVRSVSGDSGTSSAVRPRRWPRVPVAAARVPPGLASPGPR